MWISLTLFLTILNIAICAPVTRYQTVTAITNADGSLYTWSPNAASSEPTATATVAAQAAATTPAAASTSSSSGLANVLNSLASIFSGSGSSGTSDQSSSSSGTSTTGASGSWGSLLNLFLQQLGGSGSSSGTGSTNPSTDSGAGTTSSAAPALTEASPNDSGSSVPSSSSSAASSDSSTPSSSSSNSGSGSGGIYDAIYNSSEDIDKDFAKAILDSHNQYRALHGVDALSWALGPYLYAKNNADNYDCSGVLTHTHGQYGENLAAGFATGPSAVKAWYVEGETFDYSTHNEYNHFTQLVWKASTQVGCAYKDCSAEGWGKYVVCEYSPVGNVIGEEEENVLPLTS